MEQSEVLCDVQTIDQDQKKSNFVIERRNRRSKRQCISHGLLFEPKEHMEGIQQFTKSKQFFFFSAMSTRNSTCSWLASIK